MRLLALLLAAGCSGRPENAARFDRIDAPAEVSFDEEGVAHIYAASEEDLFYLQGYVTAQDRLHQMDLLRRRAHGRRAEVLGEDYVSSDTQSLALRFSETGAAAAETMRAEDPTLYRYLCAYAAGVSQYIADAEAGDNGASFSEQFTALGYTPEPWTVEDSLAIDKLLTAGLAMRPDQDIILGLMKILLGADLLADLYRYAPLDESEVIEGFLVTSTSRSGSGRRPPEAPPLPDATDDELLAAIRAARDFDMSMGGSNNMAIDAAHADGGYALLASDSHQGIAHPSVYYVIHLSGGDIDAVGATFPGVPFVLFGHNRDIAWGPTTNLFDVADAYLEQMPDEDTVIFNGEEVPVEVTAHTLRVKTASGAVEERTVETRFVPHHGPMFPADGLPLPLNISIRWTGYEPLSAARTFYELDKASDYDGFRDALTHYITGGMHWLYADTAGEIGYSSYTDVPVREVVDPESPPVNLLPGTGGYEWVTGDERSYARLEEGQLPWQRGAERGWLVTANNDPVGQTFDNDPFNDSIYLSGVFDIGTRARQPGLRFDQLIAEDGGVSFEELQDVQLDTASRVAARILPHLLDAASRRPDLLTAQAADAVALLSQWDLSCEIDDAAPTLFHAWLAYAAREVIADEAGGLIGELLFEDLDYKFGLVIVKFLAHILDETAPIIDKLDAGEAAFPSVSGINFFDDQRTEDVVETRDEVLLRGLLLALEDLQGHHGGEPDVSLWVWGGYHTIQLLDASTSAADSARQAKAGGLYTVDVGDYSWMQGGVLPEQLDVSNAPSNRFVFEMVPGAIRGEMILPGGQSERPGDDYHNDMLEEYVSGRYRAMRFWEAEVAAGEVQRWAVPAGFPDQGLSVQ